MNRQAPLSSSENQHQPLGVGRRRRALQQRLQFAGAGQAALNEAVMGEFKQVLDANSGVPQHLDDRPSPKRMFLGPIRSTSSLGNPAYSISSYWFLSRGSPSDPAGIEGSAVVWPRRLSGLDEDPSVVDVGAGLNPDLVCQRHRRGRTLQSAIANAALLTRRDI
jgi:hypothetical protein